MIIESNSPEKVARERRKAKPEYKSPAEILNEERKQRKNIKAKLNANTRKSVISTLFQEECDKMGIFKTRGQSLILMLICLAFVATVVFLLYNIMHRGDEPGLNGNTVTDDE